MSGYVASAMSELGVVENVGIAVGIASPTLSVQNRFPLPVILPLTHISSSKPHRNEISTTPHFFDHGQLNCAIAGIVRFQELPEFKMADSKQDIHQISGMECFTCKISGF
jgi:hypothetical protein